MKLIELQIKGYERVIEAIDESSGLHCIIAIHSTQLGPSMGGTRFFPYKDREQALEDVLRLSKAMTYKSAVAEDGLGGGKSVIIGDPKKIKTEKLLLAFGEVINQLGGKYITAEDVGTTPLDMQIIRKKTPYVAAMAIEKSSGDPSRFTAWGVLRGMRAISHLLFGSDGLNGLKVAIQGLGSVGSNLARFLFWEGAELIICDIDEHVIYDHQLKYGAEVVSTENFAEVQCDILCPCALGGVINEKTISKLKCKAIAGAANNQLAEPRMGLELMKKGILYAPDYVINGGGIINASEEFSPTGYDPKIARDRVNEIYETLLYVLLKAQHEGKPSNLVADEIAEYKLAKGIGKREQPISLAMN